MLFQLMLVPQKCLQFIFVRHGCAVEEKSSGNKMIIIIIIISFSGSFSLTTIIVDAAERL